MSSVKKGFGATIGVVLALIFLLFCVCAGCGVCLIAVSNAHGAQLENKSAYVTVGYVGAFPDQPCGFYFAAGRSQNIGIYFDGKRSVFGPGSEKVYNFSIDRAEKFYKSKFMGIQKYSWSIGFGITYCLLNNDGKKKLVELNNRIYTRYATAIMVIPYVALRCYHSTDYREYYDDTFRVWQNDYFLKGNSKADLGGSIGCIIGIGRMSLNFGYDAYFKNNGNWNVGIGILAPLHR